MSNQSDNNQQNVQSRPLNVIQVCILQIVTAILTLVTTVGGYDYYVQMAQLLAKTPGSQEQFFLSRAISIIISIAFAHFFYNGKNWSRIVYIVFFIITFGMWAWNLSITGKIFLDHITDLDTIINIVQILISFIVCILLLSPDSSRWFKLNKQSHQE